MKTRRKIEEKNIRKLTKISGGSSYAITLPIDVVRRWKWKVPKGSLCEKAKGGFGD